MIYNEITARETTEITYNFEVEGFHTYFVGENAVLVHNLCKADIFKSVKDSPSYDSNFSKVQNGLKKVKINNESLATELKQYGSGWQKVYSDGYLNGEKVSLHYFQDAAGNVFDVKFKLGWSALN